MMDNDNSMDYVGEAEMDGPAPPFEELVLDELRDLKFQMGGMGARMMTMETTLSALKDGVNTIGEMANSMVQAVGGVVAQVQQGGLASLLGARSNKE
jgi:hypothetical protein